MSNWNPIPGVAWKDGKLYRFSKTDIAVMHLWPDMLPLRCTKTKAWFQSGLTCLVHAMHGKDVLYQIDSYGYDNHDFPSQNKLMKRFASPSWHSVAVNRNPDGTQIVWDGEVPFIR